MEFANINARDLELFSLAIGDPDDSISAQLRELQGHWDLVLWDHVGQPRGLRLGNEELGEPHLETSEQNVV